MAEWLGNSYALQVALAICVYLILNISRVLVVKGLVMITWRSLTKEEFDVKTSCSRQGEIMLSIPEEDQRGQGTKEGRVIEDSASELDELKQGANGEDRRGQIAEVRQGIERMLSRFVFKGYMCLTVGMLLNPAWLVAVMYVQQNIAYKPL